jgi:hypothetical protein
MAKRERQNGTPAGKKPSGLMLPIIGGIVVGAIVLGIKPVYNLLNPQPANNGIAPATNADKDKNFNRKTLGEADGAPGSDLNLRDAVEKKSSAFGAARSAAVTERSLQFIENVEAGKVALKSAKYGKAADFYAKALTSPAPEKDIEGVKKIADACRLFNELTKDVKISVLAADAADLYEIKLKLGGTFKGKVTSQSPQLVKVVMDGIGTELKRSEIETMTPISGETRAKELKDALLRKKISTSRDGLSYYLLAVEYLRNSFSTEGTDLLKEAYELDPNLGVTVKEHQAYQLLKAGAWYYSVGIVARGNGKFNEIFEKYGDTKMAARAKEIQEEMQQQNLASKAESLRKKQEQLAQMDEDLKKKKAPAASAKTESRQEPENDEGDLVGTGGGGNSIRMFEGKDMENIGKGVKTFRTGMDLANEGRNAEIAKEGTKLYKQAITVLEEAKSYFEKAQKNDRGNEEIENMIGRIGQQIYWCRKMQVL